MLESMRIRGGVELNGEITISGAKNLALPALVVSLLSESKIILRNVPKLADINSLLELLSYLGVDIDFMDSNSICLQTKDISQTEAPYDFVRKMRASILVLGPLVARFKKARVSLPGGCAIGSRGVDLHIKALEHLGAQIFIEDGYINAEAPDGLVGTDITFPIATVTGTENIMMAATLAKGRTRLINAAMEPEIIAFADLLSKMGAKISGQGTPIITIDGVESLAEAEFSIIPDRIEAGTYAVAAALTNGKILLKNCIYDDLATFFDDMSLANIECTKQKDGVLVYRKSNEIKSVDIQTAPYPGFPTDLQAQFMVLMTMASGVSSITENIFENRFMHVPELCRMGANISIHGKTAVVSGVSRLAGAQVMATDLRASMSLVIAGLAARGETIVNRLYHIDRGYENIEEKLKGCGAELERFVP